MEPVRLSFTPTKDDYVRSTRIITLRQWSIRIMVINMTFFALLGVCLLIATLSTMFSTDSGMPLMTLPVPIACILVPAGMAAGLLLYVPYSAGRMFQKNERLQAPVTWEISDQSILIRSGEFAETKQDWGMFAQAIEHKDYYFLAYAINKRSVQFIPKRAFESPAHESAFRAIVEAHLGEIKK